MSFSTVSGQSGLSVLSGSIMLLLVLIVVCFPAALFAEKIIAVTESGVEFEVADVEAETEIVSIFLKNSPASLEDFIVDIRGFEKLDNLRILDFIHVPQILSYGFLAGLERLEVLTVSSGRVLNVDFLKALPQLKAFFLESCDDWETGGLPFLDAPLDLSENVSLEYLAFRLCGLSQIPSLENVPDSLRFLDLSYNQITITEDDIESHPYLEAMETIFIFGNTVELDEPPANFSTVSPRGFVNRYIE